MFRLTVSDNTRYKAESMQITEARSAAKELDIAAAAQTCYQTKLLLYPWR